MDTAISVAEGLNAESADIRPLCGSSSKTTNRTMPATAVVHGMVITLGGNNVQIH